MATSGTHGLQRQSISSKRAQRTVEAIETAIGRPISGDTSDHSTSQETLSERELGNNNEGSVDETNKR